MVRNHRGGRGTVSSVVFRAHPTPHEQVWDSGVSSVLENAGEIELVRGQREVGFGGEARREQDVAGETGVGGGAGGTQSEEVLGYEGVERGDASSGGKEGERDGGGVGAAEVPEHEEGG